LDDGAAGVQLPGQSSGQGGWFKLP